MPDPQPGDWVRDLIDNPPPSEVAERVQVWECAGNQEDAAPDIEALIEASSLGTPEAKALRDSVPAEQVRRVVELSRQLADPTVRMVRCHINWTAHPINDECQDVTDVDDGDPCETCGCPDHFCFADCDCCPEHQADDGPAVA